MLNAFPYKIATQEFIGIKRLKNKPAIYSCNMLSPSIQKLWAAIMPEQVSEVAKGWITEIGINK